MRVELHPAELQRVLRRAPGVAHHAGVVAQVQIVKQRGLFPLRQAGGFIANQCKGNIRFKGGRALVGLPLGAAPLAQLQFDNDVGAVRIQANRAWVECEAQRASKDGLYGLYGLCGIAG